jgi:sugar phosphate isomerase/epimerase
MTSSQRSLRVIRTAIADADLDVVCLASYVEVARASYDPLADLLWHVDAARELGAPFVRVFGAAEPESGARSRAVARLGVVANAIHESGVTILLETHDSFPTGAAVGEILDEVGSPNLGAIWDVVNPWRHGEAARDTLERLGPWMRHIQLKDVKSARDLTPVLPGAGSVPLREILGLLAGAGYDAWLSLEWERAWYPAIPPLPTALEYLSDILTLHAAAADRLEQPGVEGG